MGATGGPESKLTVVGLVEIDLSSEADDAEWRFGGLGDNNEAEAEGDMTVDGTGDEEWLGGMGLVLTLSSMLALSSVRRESSESERERKLETAVDALRGRGTLA